jgi:hypothetical protein
MKEHFGYTEPFRRFVQHETFTPQANEIPNTAASWLPGDDYYVNFHEGDPFIKVDEGYLFEVAGVLVFAVSQASISWGLISSATRSSKSRWILFRRETILRRSLWWASL